MPSHLETLIHRVKQGFSAVELVHTPHDRWPLPRHTSDIAKRLRISVLDSSFNPPTLAHLALASIPAPTQANPLDATRSSQEHPDFDARLLLLSVRNADKTLKPGDATYTQRLDMMVLLAQAISEQGVPPAYNASDSRPDPNVAVAIIDEPTFVGKSRALQEYLGSRLLSLASRVSDASRNEQPTLADPSPAPKPELTFVVGIDTLERILAIRYYSTEENMRRCLSEFLGSSGDNSRLICARRVTPGSLETPDEREHRVAAAVRDYLEPEKVVMVDIGEKIESYSSSEVRERVASGDVLWTQIVTPQVAQYIRKEHLYLAQPSSNENV